MRVDIWRNRHHLYNLQGVTTVCGKTELARSKHAQRSQECQPLATATCRDCNCKPQQQEKLSDAVELGDDGYNAKGQLFCFLVLRELAETSAEE